MGSEVKTQEQLEELLKNPKGLQDYIIGVARETMGDAVKDLGPLVKTQALAAFKEMGGPIKRPPMTDGSDPALPGTMMNGKFPRFRDFLKAIWNANRPNSPLDERLANYTVAKALNETAGGDGGFLVPEEFRATLLELAIEEAVIRPRATIIPMGGPVVNIPAVHDTTHLTNVYGGVQAYWNPEAADLSTDVSQPTFRQVRLDAKKLTGYTVVSNELMTDAAIAIEALLTRMFGVALTYFEDDAFINGTGVGQPLGILNAGALISVTKETAQAATTIVAENLDKMYSRMLPTSRNRAVWLAHPDIFPQLAALSRAVGTGGSAVWMTNIAGGPPSSIYGRPIIFTEKCQTLGTLGDIYFADLSYYLIGDRMALTMASSPHVKFTTDETVWRFIQRVDGRPWVNSALTPRKGSNTLSPFVALATRS